MAELLPPWLSELKVTLGRSYPPFNPDYFYVVAMAGWHNPDRLHLEATFVIGKRATEPIDLHPIERLILQVESRDFQLNLIQQIR